ncbi:Eukaryotic/viral aspartic protease [Phytophthora megakarya]|uniref:Eukaryotic/viral aspartic protease n=1 Tax=Phytophthora megakarya TaxID=4795 RepID=A0A225V992_9STRA|nr:Eukaryotic/viral aspartic protease [Phytophthora megakarya]
MVEAACRATHVSYRVFGILVKFDSYRQSQAYPGFERHKPDIHILKERWDLEAYQALVYVPEPIYVRDLNSGTLAGIKDYVDFMRINAKTWWVILHWLTISFLVRDAADEDSSRDLYEERRKDVKRLRARLVYGRFLFLDDLDVEDPIRTQWAAPHTDNDILATVPAFMHPLLMMPERRSRNVIPLSAASRA